MNIMESKIEYVKFLERIKQLPLCERWRLASEFKRVEAKMKRTELNNRIVKYISYGTLAFVVGIIGFSLLKFIILTILQ